MGKAAEGTTEPGSALADSQRHMNAASDPMPPLADGILDLCSSPDTSPAPKVTMLVTTCVSVARLQCLSPDMASFQPLQHILQAMCVCVCVCVCVSVMHEMGFAANTQL